MPLKVLFVAYDYFPGIAGGAEQQARFQAEELVRRGHEVTVVCYDFGGVGSGVVNGVQVRRLWPGPKGFHWLGYYHGAARFLWTNIRDFDIVHVHTPSAIGRLAVLAGRIRGRRVYFKVTYAPDSDGRSALERWLGLPRREYLGLAMAARLQALTPLIRAQLLQAGIAARKVCTIPNGVDTSRFRPADVPGEKMRLRRRLGLPEDRLLFLYAGRFDATKGVEVVLNAWRSLEPAPKTGLVLAGTYRTGLPIEPVTDEPGLVVREWTAEIGDYYRAADVFVLPSFREGMSNAVLEAMACGLPLVVTPAGAAVDVVRDGVNGLIVPPGNVEALRSAMLRLGEDAGLRAKLGSAAAESARKYSIESVVSQIEAAYAAMMAERVRAAGARA